MVRFASSVLGLTLLVSTVHAQEAIPCVEPVAEAPATTAADDSSASDEGEERARRLYLLGDDLYMQGRYEEALTAFEQSYELSGRPLLLYNMANVYERTGEFDEALLKLEAYLPHATDDERPRLRTRIESLRDRVARLEARRQREAELLRLGQQPPPPRERVDLGALLTTLGGAVLIGGGLGLALFGRNAGAELDDLCRDVDGRTYCPSEAERFEKRERRALAVADGLLVAGVATVAVGIWLFVRDDDEDEDEEPEPEVDVWLGPGGGGAQVRHAF